MKYYLIFAGTTEGRHLIDFFLNQKDARITACVATDYGKLLLTPHPHLTILSQRLDEAQMFHLMKQQPFDAVFDATHPYAVIVSQNIRSAATDAALPCYRILRPADSYEKNSSQIVSVPSMDAAVDYLSQTNGNILATTGSKELSKLCALPDYQTRIYARILSNPEMIADSFALGFTGRHLICMQGPFSKEMNIALIHEFDIRYTLTKNSGQAGGFQEKKESALETGTTLVVIERPTAETVGYSLSDIYKIFSS